MTGWLLGLLYVTVVGAGLLMWVLARRVDRAAEKVLQTALQALQPPPPPAVLPPPDVVPLVRELMAGITTLVQGPSDQARPVSGGPLGGPISQEEDEPVAETFIPSWEVDDWLPEDTTELDGEWSAHTQPFPGGPFEMSPEGERFMFGNGGIRLPDLDR